MTYKLVNDIMDIEWKKIIVEIKLNGVIIIYGIFHMNDMSRNEE